MKKEVKRKNGLMNFISQFALPVFTISAQVAIALKYPEWGIVINMMAQPFWLYSAWKAYKEAKQVGMFVTTVIMTIVMAFGIINYWVKF